MPGFEVAGVILGVLPLVIDALADYREGNGVVATLLKFRGLLDSLIRQLKTQKTNFYLDILRLLRDARVCDDADPTEERCVAILREAKTSSKVIYYLGQLYQPFLEILGYYESYLKVITCKLKHIVQPENTPIDDLDAILQANSGPKKHSPIKGRLKFTIDRKSLEALVKDLSTERYSLGKLIKRVKTQRDWEAAEPSRGSTKMAQVFTQVQVGATSLYNAMCQHCVCDVHDQHTAMIRLENRIVEPCPGSNTALTIFRLCFPIEEASLQEIEIRARADEAGQGDAEYQRTEADSTRMLKSQNDQLPTIIVIATREDMSQPVSTRIVRMCDNAREARERGQILALELTANGLELIKEPVQSQQSFKSTMTLANLLAAVSHDRSPRMMPKQQTLLALDVATSVLQLRHTSWCSVPWNNKTVKFLVDGDGNMATCAPYVEQAINTALLAEWPPDLRLGTQMAKATLLELAILMLEILHHESIETWAVQNFQASIVTFWDRVQAATQWLELSNDKLLPDHLEAIEACLTHCVRSKLSWDLEFQKLYCENIVKPLQQLVLPRHVG